MHWVRLAASDDIDTWFGGLSLRLDLVDEAERHFRTGCA